MTCVTSRSWPLRCPGFGRAEASQTGRQNKARRLGRPFSDVRDVKTARSMRKAVERELIERRRNKL